MESSSPKNPSCVHKAPACGTKFHFGVGSLCVVWAHLQKEWGHKSYMVQSAPDPADTPTWIQTWAYSGAFSSIPSGRSLTLSFFVFSVTSVISLLLFQLSEFQSLRTKAGAPRRKKIVTVWHLLTGLIQSDLSANLPTPCVQGRAEGLLTWHVPMTWFFSFSESHVEQFVLSFQFSFDSFFL